MQQSKVIDESLEKIKEEINKTSDFIHINTDTKPMTLIKIYIDKLHELKEMEYNIKQLL